MPKGSSRDCSSERPQVNTIPTIDGFSNETVELGTGKVFQLEITPMQRLDRCFDLESFMNVSYGPPTDPALEKFLLPTPLDEKLKCSDRFVDLDWQPYLRAYTDLQRLCQQLNIPNVFAIEAMRSMMKRKRGMFSENMHIHALMFAISIEPRLFNRIDKLEEMIVPRKEPINRLAEPVIMIAIEEGLQA